MTTQTTNYTRPIHRGSIEKIIRRFFPRLVEKIAQEEADKIVHYVATGGGLESEINGDLVVIGLLRIIPAGKRRG